VAKTELHLKYSNPRDMQFCSSTWEVQNCTALWSDL